MRDVRTMPTDDDVRRFPRADPEASARLAGAFGIASALLLGASFLWAHHWGALAVTIVTLWALTTLAGALAGVLSGGTRRGWFSRTGLVCVWVSILVFLGTTAAYAMGADPVAACGGG